MKPEHVSRTYYPVLDGIRGLAILLVIFYHNFGFIDYFFFGWLGVDLFFVLSGYLITDILLRSFGSPNYLRNFYIRRVLRIFPLYYATLIIFLIIIPRFTNIPLDLSYYIDNQFWLWTYLQNWLFVFNRPVDATALNHLWSLAVEEQFYLFWPLTILLLRKPRRLFWVVFVLLLAVITARYLIWINKVEDLAYFNLYTFTRIDGICIGCMLALLQRISFHFLKKFTPIIVFSLAGLNFLFYFFNSRYQFTFPYLAIIGYTTFAVIFALLIHEAIMGENRIINVIFSNSILRFFGRISYGLYVFHWPLYLILSPYIIEWARSNINNFSSQIIASLVCTIVAILFSYVSFRYFEKIFLRWKDRFL